MLDLTTLGAAKRVGAPNPVTTATFETDVLAASMQRPVIVDFWAPWCNPCKQMMPVIEKTVGAANGAVTLATVNIDENPELAQVFRIQSVPMVFAFFQGQPVDGFSGSKPESELKAFVTKLAKLAGSVANDAAPAGVIDKAQIAKWIASGDQHLRNGNLNEAMVDYSHALDADPENMDAMASIGWCLVAMQEGEGLDDLLSQLTDEQKKHPRIAGLLFVRGHAQYPRVTDTPKDAAGYFAMAQGLIGALSIESAMDALVDAIKKDRAWQDEAARKLLVSLLEALGPAHPLAKTGRRKLSTLLFA